jgi:N-methylhydantoinase B
MVFAGEDPATGSPYVYLETLGGGMGGRNDRDGKDGVQVHITNTSNLPIEAIEMEYPLRVEEYSLVVDSGGAGRWRGGLGLRRVVRPVEHACEFSGAGERFRRGPPGIFGGEAGKAGVFILRRADGSVENLPGKLTSLMLDPSEAVAVETPGAGGYGKPRERSQEKLAEDLSSEKFTLRHIEDHYGSDALSFLQASRRGSAS